MMYIKPTTDIIKLNNQDIITTSGWNNNGNGSGNGHWFEEKPGHGSKPKNIVNTQTSSQYDSIC